MRDAAAAPPSLAADLAMWRARRAGGEHHLDDACALILFGVGLATLERIEGGEVAPSPELADRIGRIVYAHSDASRPRGAFNSGPGLSPGQAQEGPNSPATPTAGNEGGAALSPLLGAAPLAVVAGDYGPPVPIPPPSPALARADDGTFHVEMFLGPVLLEMEIDEAEQLAGELQALVALTRDPLLYDAQPRLARPSIEES